MDSLTQAALGATVAYAVTGRQLGRKSLLIGAALGTLPDLDVLFPYEDAIDSFTYHRSWSHSYLVLTVITPIVSFLLYRGIPKSWLSIPSLMTHKKFMLMVWLVLITHVMLDGFTVYGTQVWWPIPVDPVAIGSIFIIDPTFTLPLLIAIVYVVLKFRSGSDPDSNSGSGSDVKKGFSYACSIALLISVTYLMATVLIQKRVESVATNQLQGSFDSDALIALPTPGGILWRVIARKDDTYLEGFYSLLKRNRPISFESFEIQEQLLAPVADNRNIKRIKWFTGGFYNVSEENGFLIVSNLRMGIEAQYVFRFKVARRDSESGDVAMVAPTELLRFYPDMERIKWVLGHY